MWFGNLTLVEIILHILSCSVLTIISLLRENVKSGYIF